MRRYLVFATVGLALLLYSMNISGAAVAFPAITSSFDTSLILTGWVLSVFQLTATAAMPLAGKAGDIFGGKLTFLIVLLLFTVGSFACAVAPNIYILILSRSVQAIGGGSILPLAAGIVAEEFPRARQQAIGLFSSILPMGAIVGPNLGGWMIESLGWRSLFWFNIPIGVMLLIAAALLVRPGRKGEGSIDLAGAGLFTGSLFAFMAGLSEIGNVKTGSSWGIAVLLLVAGIILIIAFWRHEKKVANPIVDLAVITERPFMAANFYNFVIGAYILGAMSLVPLYAVSVYGMSTLASGFILTPRSIGQIATSIITSMMLPRLGYRRPILAGTVMIMLSLLLLGIEPSGFNMLGIQVGHTALLLAIMLLSGIGTGIAVPAANNACIDLMPHRVATITGVRGMFRQTGGAMGIAIFAILLQNIPGIKLGFSVVMIGLSVIMLMTIPIVFAMPSAPGTPPLAKATDH